MYVRMALIITARKRSLGQGNIFTPIILFTGGGLPQCMHPPPGTMHPPRDHAPSPQDHATPPGTEHAGRYGQRAGGTHPTGMQSC